MGKRELLLIAIFVLVGLGVYQMTAPPGSSSSNFSIHGLVEKIRSEIRGQHVEAKVTRSATAPAPPTLTTVKLEGVRGTITVLGEAREDVVVELQTTAFGADEAQAREFEKAFALELVANDDVLDVQVKTTGPEMHRRPRLELTIRMPERLAFDISTLGGELKISRVARVILGRGSGRGFISEIAGSVEGEFGPGVLDVEKAGSVKLETERTELRVSTISGNVTLDSSGSELRVRTVKGATTLTLERVEAEAEELSGPVKVEAEGGECRLRDVRAPIVVKGDRLTLRITLGEPVPVTAVIENDLIEVTLPREGVTLDAHAEHGQVRVPDRVVEVEAEENGSRARGPVRGGGPTIKLETTRGDILIR